ncbi:hypothetical protein D3C80_1789500 [compost metagenome]
MALRLAQFYERICLLEHHLALETVLRVLESKLKNIDNGIVDQSFREAIDEFIADTELRKERGESPLVS